MDAPAGDGGVNGGDRRGQGDHGGGLRFGRYPATPFRGLIELGDDAGFRPAAVTLRFILVVRSADSGG